MSDHKPMSLLLIEDDVAECIKFKDCANNRTDVNFVGMTGSSAEGIQYVKTRMPEGIILDLELHKGKGSGLQFLTELRTSGMELRPVVVVTTNSASHVVYNHVHDMGTDMVFYKRQEDYSPDMVINTMLALRKALYTVQRDDLPADLQTLESPEEQRARIARRIETELDLIGIRERYKGRAYVEEAIFLLINKDTNSSDAVLAQVAKQRKLTYSNVIRAVQTVINKAWSSSSIEDLQKYYTARVNIHVGVPSPTDFVHYYANKIRKTL